MIGETRDLRIAVLGSGAFGLHTTISMATLLPPRSKVFVFGRNPDSLSSLCCLWSRQRRAAEVEVRTILCDLTSISAMDQLAQLRPDGIAVAASLYSPSTKPSRLSRWDRLILEAGFGITAPFQLYIWSLVSQYILQSLPDVPLFNACYPDALNSVLANAGHVTPFGLGNLGLLAATLALGSPEPIRALGCHLHLHTPKEPEQEMRAWVGRRPLVGVGQRLSKVRALNRFRRNRAAARASGHLIAAYYDNRSVIANVSGPVGELGGYPVRIGSCKAEIDLGSLISAAEALTINVGWLRDEGIDSVVDGRILFTDRSVNSLRPYIPGVSGVSLTDAVEISKALLPMMQDLEPC